MVLAPPNTMRRLRIKWNFEVGCPWCGYLNSLISHFDFDVSLNLVPRVGAFSVSGVCMSDETIAR